MQKTTPPSMLYRGGIADLPLLRKLAIRQKSQELSFWEVMDSFVLVAYASLVDMNFVDNELFPFRVTVLCIRSSVKTISGEKACNCREILCTQFQQTASGNFHPSLESSQHSLSVLLDPSILCKLLVFLLNPQATDLK